MTPARDARARTFRSLLPRELQSRTTPLSRCIAAGLRTYGRAAYSSRFLLQAASQTRRFSANGVDSFPFTAAGQLRIHTGFPIRPSICARHRDKTQDMGFCGGRQLFATDAERPRQSALLLSKKSYIIRAHFRFGLLGTRASAWINTFGALRFCLGLAPVAQPDRAPAF